MNLYPSPEHTEHRRANLAATRLALQQLVEQKQLQPVDPDHPYEATGFGD